MHRHARSDRHGNDVDAFGAVSRPGHLGAENTSRRIFDHQFEEKHFRRRHKVGPIGRRRQDRQHIVAVVASLEFGQARSSDAVVEHLADGASQHAGKGLLTTAEIDSGDASLLVGGGSEGDVAGFAGDQVEAFDAISHRIDIRVGGTHGFVDLNGAGGFSQIEAGAGRQPHIGAHADGQNNHIDGDFAAVGTHASHPLRIVVPPLDRHHAGMGHDLDALAFHVPFHQAGDLPVEHAQHLCFPFDDGDPAATAGEGLGNLDAHEPAADNDDIAGQSRCQGRLDAFGVRHAMKGEHPSLVDAREGWNDGGSPGGQHQFVVRNPRFFAARPSANAHPLAVPVDFQGLGGTAHMHIFDFLKKDRVAGHAHGGGGQFPFVADSPRDVVGQTAAGIGENLALFDDGDIGIGPQANGFRGGFRSRRHAADDDHAEMGLRIAGPQDVSEFLLGNQRQGHGEPGTPEIRLVGPDTAAELSHHRTDEGQPQPHAGTIRTAGRGGTEKRLENVLPIFFRNPDAAIMHLDIQLAPVARAKHIDPNSTMIGGILEGVAEQGAKHLPQSGRRHADMGGVQIAAHGKRNVPAREVVVHAAFALLHATDHLAEAVPPFLLVHGADDVQHAAHGPQRFVQTVVRPRQGFSLLGGKRSGIFSQDGIQQGSRRRNGAFELMCHEPGELEEFVVVVRSLRI